MFKKLDRRVNMMNPDGTFLTKHVCPETGKNMPSIADIQLYNEFVDFKYLKYGELDHFKWQELYPRLYKWHLAMSQDDDEFIMEHTRGVREVQAQFDQILP